MLSVSHYSYFWTMQFTISKTQYVDSWDIARLSKRNDNYDGLIITKSDFDNHEIFNLKIEIISSDGINCVHGQIVVFRLKNYVLYRCLAKSVSFTCAGFLSFNFIFTSIFSFHFLPVSIKQPMCI